MMKCVAKRCLLMAHAIDVCTGGNHTLLIVHSYNANVFFFSFLRGCFPLCSAQGPDSESIAAAAGSGEGSAEGALCGAGPAGAGITNTVSSASGGRNVSGSDAMEHVAGPSGAGPSAPGPSGAGPIASGPRGDGRIRAGMGSDAGGNSQGTGCDGSGGRGRHPRSRTDRVDYSGQAECVATFPCGKHVGG
jgi:hypothetical protein